MAEIKYEIDKTQFESLLKKLDKDTAGRLISESLTRSGLDIRNWIRDQRLSGPRPELLGVKSGNLKESITSSECEKKGDVYTVTIATNVNYAYIHEFGGVILPKSKKFLSWIGSDGKRVFAKKVVMPARPFMYPAIENDTNIELVIEDLTDTFAKHFEGLGSA